MKPKPLNPLAVFLGDPASIGSEVALKAISQFLREDSLSEISLHLFGSRKSLTLSNPQLSEDILHHPRIELVDSEKLTSPLHLGQGRAETAHQALEDLKQAARFCLAHPGTALVTGPVDKSLCALIQSDFRGQTGFLKKLSGAESVTMMLAGGGLRVALVTTHIPLKEVAHHIQERDILRCLRHSLEFLEFCRLPKRVAVLGLNPHASDHSLMGNEEEKVISPAIRKAEKEFGVSIAGPLSPDTAFLSRDHFETFVCMYHDQGLIPLKLLAFDEAVNISLGLPFLRVSVDHGTAFDIAGKGVASEKSFFNALRLAAEKILRA